MIFGKTKKSSVFVRCFTYTLFHSLTYNTWGYFASCVVYLQARRDDEKFEQKAKCLLVLFLNPSNKVFIIPLLFLFNFLYLNSTLRSTSYSPIWVWERRKQHQWNYQGVPCDQQKKICLAEKFISLKIHAWKRGKIKVWILQCGLFIALYFALFYSLV